MAFDFGLSALKDKFSNTSSTSTGNTNTSSTNATQKKTPRKTTFWRKFLSALKGFFVRK